MEFLGLVVLEIFGGEFDFTGFVFGAAFGRAVDGKEAPVGFVDAFFQLPFQVGGTGVGVLGGDEVIDQSEKIRAVTGTHELLGGDRFRRAEVKWLATGGVGFAAFAGAQGKFSRACGAFRRFVHRRKCVDGEEPINGNKPVADLR